jgi:hypothetical protein
MNTHAVAANQPVFNERGLLDANIPPEAEIQKGMLRSEGQSFAQWMESRVARFQTRRYAASAWPATATPCLRRISRSRPW